MGRDRYVEINGVRLRFRDEGQGAAILMIHGWTLDLDMWEPQVRDLSRNFRIVRFDRRGFGLSSGTAGIAEDAADAQALCGHLGIRRVALVGMSQGARVLQMLVGLAPRMISSIVFDGAPDIRPGGRLTAEDIPLTRLSSLARKDGVEAFRREWAQHPLARLVTSETRARELLSVMIGRYSASDLLALNSGRGSAAPQALRSRSLQMIRIPALVLNGRLDIASRRRAGNALARALNFPERALIPRAGHLPNLDNPQAYNRTLRCFLQRHNSKGI